ncbi:MAG: hemerythrin domain-containing protein [Solirubrobacteraceae bacterium]
MDLFERLGGEHRRLVGVCEALGRFLPRLVEDPLAQMHELLRFVTFLNGYGEGYHRELEETVLFPLLVKHEVLSEKGPLAHLREQHVEEQRCLFELESKAAARTPWSTAQAAAVQAAGHALVSFYLTHMRKEGELLFPTAKQALLPAHAAEIDHALERFEARRAPRWNATWLVQLGDELIAAHPGS